MNYNSDLETIESLHILQETINKALLESKSRLEKAEELKESADFIQAQIDEIKNAYKILQKFGSPEEIGKTLERIKSSNEMLDGFENRYQRVKEEIESLNTSIRQEQENINKITQTVNQLEEIKLLILEKAERVEETRQLIESLGGVEEIKLNIDKITGIDELSRLKITVELQEMDIKLLNKKVKELESNKINTPSLLSNELQLLKIQYEQDRQTNKNNFQIIKNFVIELNEKQRRANLKLQVLTEKVERLLP